MDEQKNSIELSDEELIRENSVVVNGHRYIRARVLDAIGKRQAKLANRRPGDPGTEENPIFKNGHAFLYNSRNRLVMWEDYEGEVPQGEGVIFRINPETTETFTLKHNMQPSEEQREMIQRAQRLPRVFSEDCPAPSQERLERFREYGRIRNEYRAEQERKLEQ